MRLLFNLMQYENTGVRVIVLMNHADTGDIMLDLVAAKAILMRWGMTERMEDIGFPSQCFYLSHHAAGYRNEAPLYWEDDRVERALTALKSASITCYRNLRRRYVDQQKARDLDRAVNLFCECWDQCSS